MSTPSNITIIRIADVLRRTGLSRSSIYEKLNPSSRRYDSQFPPQVRLGASSVGWVEAEITAWLELRISASRRAVE